MNILFPPAISSRIQSRRFICRMKCAFSCSSRFYTAFQVNILCMYSPWTRPCLDLFWPSPKIMTQFGCHNYFKTLLDVPHPYPNIFLLNLGELEKWFWLEVGGGGVKSTQSSRGTTTDWKSFYRFEVCGYFAASEWMSEWVSEWVSEWTNG